MNQILLLILIILTPLFFLPITVEYFSTNKLYFLILMILTILITSLIQFIISKKIKWSSRLLDLPIVLLVIALINSTIFLSTNKIQAILNPNFGLLAFVGMTIIYFYLSRNHQVVSLLNNKIFPYLSSLFSLVIITLFINPFKIDLSILFNVRIDIILYLGFFLIINVFNYLDKRNGIKLVFIILNLTALILNGYYIISSQMTFQPSFYLSWFAAVEILKNPISAIMGVGVNNFPSLFSQVKDIFYNQTMFWQVSTYSLSRSLILHLTTESGLLALSGLILIFFNSFRLIKNHLVSSKIFLSLSIYILIAIILAPPSFNLIFLMYLTFGYIATLKIKNESEGEIDITHFPVVYIIIIIFYIVIISLSIYTLGRSYLSEISFKKSISAISKNDGQTAYNSLRQAIILNPYDERYIYRFSQINMQIANNLASKSPDKITEQDRQVIAQAIQAGIEYSKILLKYNPKRADYWENLAFVYKNIINVAKDADIWSISAYQRAVTLDPLNPRLRLNLGSVYYLLGQYPDAIKFFEQAVELKNNWPNSHYNLAWAYYQNKQYDKAALTMTNVSKLIDKNDSVTDWELVQKDLKEFEKKLLEYEKDNNQELTLPNPSLNKIEPELELPKEASPEAKL